MPSLKEWVSWEKRRTEPLVIGSQTVQLESRAIWLRFPYGGRVWHWPTAVYVQQPEGEQRLPIIDVTRAALLAFTGAAVTLSLLLRLPRPTQKRNA